MDTDMDMGGDIQRILLCGAQSTGKSTLMSDVIQHLKVQFGGEVGRSIMKENGWVAESIDPGRHPEVFEELQVLVLRKQRDLDQKFIHSGESYMSDRSIDPLVYAAVYQGEGAKDKLLQTELGQYCIERVRKSILFLITPHKEIARNDSMRMTADFSKMVQYTEVMKRLLTQHNIPFEEVTVLDRQARVEQVLSKISSVCPTLVKRLDKTSPM